jgi:hypothetical protein
MQNGQSLQGAQPGQTGTMESQRNTAINRAYVDQQQQTEAGALQRSNQQNLGDINQLAPSAQRQGVGGAAIGSPGMNRGVAPYGRLNRPGFSPSGVPTARGYRGGLNIQMPRYDRNFILNDLRVQGQQADDWRLVERDGRWWFWTPNESWLYYTNGVWSAYRTGEPNRSLSNRQRDVSFPSGYAAEDWRLVFHNGRWWFWTPNQTWKYFQRGGWNDLNAQRALARQQQASGRYGVGYRGAEESMSNENATNANPNQPAIDPRMPQARMPQDPSMNQPQLPPTPATDPLNNPAATSTTPSNPPIVPETAEEAATNPIKTQDEAGMNVDAQH